LLRVKPWRVLAEATSPDGGRLVLSEHDGELVIRVDGEWLMSSRAHGSEEEMAAAGACTGDARVLVGGLGCGYTLRATLDRLGPRGQVTVAEISPAIVEWNRAELGPLAGHPLRDPRVSLAVADVATVVRGAASGFDAILLDVDNGPQALTARSNEALYQPRGLLAFRSALRPGGRLVVWSAGPDTGFTRRLRAAGLTVEERPVRARGPARGARHLLFVAQRPL
jgi:spermidine synthase